MKKKLIMLALCATMALGVVGLTACDSEGGNASTPVVKEAVTAKTADEALAALKAGNADYLNGTATMNVSSELREDLATNGQSPHTVVITCSDSRVPPELLFNSSLGELFVIRTAGNVVDDFEIGSVEYAADHLGSPLVVVLGHSHCGAVGAAVEGHAEGYIESIVHEIEPSVEAAKKTAEGDEVATVAENLNVENSIETLRESDILKKLEQESKCKIVGAKYDIDTGAVTFFE